MPELRHPNRLLRTARGHRSQADLADAANAEIARATNTEGALTAKYISDLERGRYTWPGEFVRNALCNVLRVSDPADLGFIHQRRPTGIALAVGLHYPSNAPGAIGSLTELWQADLAQDATLLACSPEINAWNEASLSWLVNSVPPAITHGPNSRKVGTTDIVGVRATADMFDQLDARFGGGHARTAFIEFLRRDLTQLLNGTYTEATGRELFRVAAQATQLGAWMSYDAGLHGLAQRYFIQALKLADTSGDRLLAGSILDAMSHQATFLGRFQEAANLARAARTGTESLGSAASAAHFSVMEARALARLGDASACDQAMSVAVTAFERRRHEDHAEWFDYFDDAELAAELGHCNRDLGRPKQATSYAAQSVGTNGTQVRSDFFATMVLADGHLDHGDAEEACRVALTALHLGEQLKSTRCGTYVDEFRQRLTPLGASPVVRDFLDQAAGTRLWTPDDARTAPNRVGSLPT